MGQGRLAVVGAGLAGLSAAVELKERGFEVELFERTRLLGGKATSFEVDGKEVDNGQHIYLACCSEFIDFIHQIAGFAGQSPDDLLYLQPRFEALLLARGKPPATLRSARLPSPLHLAPSLLRYRHLSLGDRLKIGIATLRARSGCRPGETMAAWLSRHGQSQSARQAFWDPFLVPSLNAPLEEASAEAGLHVITTAFLSDSGAARIGFARVPLARLAAIAADRLDAVHLRTSVTGIELTSGSTPAFGFLRLSDGAALAFDGVVLAVPPAGLERIVGDAPKLGLADLDQFRTAAIVDVHLWFDVPELDFGFAALLDSPVQWVFQKAPGYLCCSLSAADAHVQRPSVELIALCRQELCAVLPALRGAELLHGAATRDREATFVPVPGLRRPGPRTACPQVVIAGAWTDTGWPATMESAVRSGRAAARTLAANLAATGKDAAAVG
jgi:hydroxysqualene dehydroxylase